MGWIRRETEKGTTQYICPNCHDYHEFREDFGEQTFNANFIFCRRCGARNGTGTAPTLTPSNEPLTLEQLRKMDGEPVYIIIDGVEPLKMWVLIEADGEDIYLTNNLGGRSYYEEARKLYKFKLYRRPPEVSP